MVAIPNAAKRSYKLMAMLKAEGFRAGIPDVLFLVARRGFMGMAIEFKTPGNKPKQHQQEFIDMMKQEGWHVLVLTDPMLAIQEVKLYLGI